MDQIPADRVDPTSVGQVAIESIPEDAVFLDVRNQDEWDLGHAPNAVHIPLPELPDRLAELPQTDGPLVVTCRGGGRASRAVAWLNAQGIEAANLTDGMLGWQEQGRLLEGEVERPRVQ